jgi:hypothetical protein
MIPNREWGSDIASRFLSATQVGPTPDQGGTQNSVGCVSCVRQGLFVGHSTIYYLDGTSYCGKHVVS